MSENFTHDFGQVLGQVLGRQKCLLNCTPEDDGGRVGVAGVVEERGGRREHAQRVRLPRHVAADRGYL